MLYETDYWFWESAIPSNLCDDIVQHGLSKQESKAFTGTADDPTPEETADKIRQSNVSWLNDRWIYNTLHPYVNAANKNAGWNFDWDWSENIQFTKYKLNQFYDWHQDAYDKVYPENYGSNQAGKIRKLSIIVTLVDGSEYDGGDLQINFRHRHKIDEIKTINEIRPKGSVIVFPSYIFHRVTPVTRGTRYSLVNWNLGYPYR
jgi:PKHD-type hydroxylase